MLQDSGASVAFFVGPFGPFPSAVASETPVLVFSVRSLLWFRF